MTLLSLALRALAAGELAGVAARMAWRGFSFVVLVALALGIALAAVGFGAVAGYIALDGWLPPGTAALVVAGGLLVLALLAGLCARWVWHRPAQGRLGVAPAAAPAGEPLTLALAALCAGLLAGTALDRRR